MSFPVICSISIWLSHIPSLPDICFSSFSWFSGRSSFSPCANSAFLIDMSISVSFYFYYCWDLRYFGWIGSGTLSFWICCWVLAVGISLIYFTWTYWLAAYAFWIIYSTSGFFSSFYTTGASANTGWNIYSCLITSGCTYSGV